jgi:hypothetical protein
MSGLTDNYVRVHATAPQDLWNEITNVALVALEDGAVRGVLAPVGVA